MSLTEITSCNYAVKMRDALQFPEDGCYLTWWFHSLNIKGQIEEGWVK